MENQTTQNPIRDGIPNQLPKRFSILSVLLSLLIFLLLISTSLLAYQNWQLRQQLNAPTTYVECIKAPGSVLQESYPATCVTKDGKKSFKQILTDAEKKNLQPSTDPTANWKTYKDSNNKFAFLYPPRLQIIDDLRNIPMNSIYVNIENVDINTTIKQNEFDITKLRDVPIPGRSGEAFKRGSFEKNTNGLIAFFPLNRSQTLIITEYFDAPVADTNINSQFDQILSTFKLLDQITPGPTCKSRPACLDATPRCLLPETSDMCPPNQKL